MPRIEDYSEDLTLDGSEKVLLSDNGTVKNTTLAKIKEFFNFISLWGGIAGNISDQSDLKNALDGKQDTLESGTNIKTINNQSILGSGNIEIIGGGTVDLTNYYNKDETDLLLNDKSDTTHNHTLSSLSEKDYSSLDNKPDLDLKLDKESPTINGDLELLQSDKGIILKSVGGARYRLTVDDNGNLETEAL